MPRPQKPKVPIPSGPVDLLALANSVHQAVDDHTLNDPAGGDNEVIQAAFATLDARLAPAELDQANYLALENQKKLKRAERDAKLADIRDALRDIRDAGFLEFAPTYERIGELGFNFFYGGGESPEIPAGGGAGDAAIIGDGELNPV